MSPTAVLLMLFSGLSFLPACSPLHYVLVEKNYTASEARSHCREKYADLASVHNQEDLTQLQNFTGQNAEVWIGLRPDRGSWRWSLEDPDYYGEGEADYSNWALFQDDSVEKLWKACVMSNPWGKWYERDCMDKYPFFCYDKNANKSFIYNDIERTWDEAQNYCRTNHTDLASIRNRGEKNLLTIHAAEAWIGLYRDGWKWTDGSTLSFSNWAPEAPQGDPSFSCGASVSGQWVNDDCKNKKLFVCFEVPPAPPAPQVPQVQPAFTETRRVKVVLHRLSSSVDMEELQEGILEEFNRRVKELGLSGNVKLRWVKQSDGKIFHKQEEEEEEEEEEKTCPR